MQRNAGHVTVNMKQFSARLRELVGNTQEMRPLLCEGNPLECTVAVVGINPATTTPFWPFWSDDQGMDRVSWIAAYKAQHSNKLNRSRAALERFLPQLAAQVIELNAYAKQSARLAELQSEHRTTNVFEFVLCAVKPRLVICAGVAASSAVESLSLPWEPKVVSARHFIYWGRVYERELATQINRLL